MKEYTPNQELIFAIALLNQEGACWTLPPVDTLEKARPSFELLKTAIDRLFFVQDSMDPDSIIERGQYRRELYDNMLLPYGLDPACHDDLLLKLVRERALGWGAETEYFNDSNVMAIPKN